MGYDVDRSHAASWVRFTNSVKAGQSFERDIAGASWDDLSSASLSAPGESYDSNDEVSCSVRLKAYPVNTDDPGNATDGPEPSGPTLAFEPVIPAGRYFIQSALGGDGVLDVKGGSSARGANVQLYQYNNSAAQRWEISFDEDGLATIGNVCSGLVLDVSGGKSANGANVQQWSPNGSLAQKWRIVDDRNGYVRIFSELAVNVALDIAGGKTTNGTNVQVYAGNGSTAQRFRLVSLSPDVSAEGK